MVDGMINLYDQQPTIMTKIITLSLRHYIGKAKIVILDLGWLIGKWFNKISASHVAVKYSITNGLPLGRQVWNDTSTNQDRSGVKTLKLTNVREFFKMDQSCPLFAIFSLQFQLYKLKES